MANQEATFRSSLAGDVLQRVAGAVQGWFSERHSGTRRAAVGAILIVALIAFELFNYDTTEYALENLLGTVGFLGIRWATILAIAFCSIDFAGLARLITGGDKQGGEQGGRLQPDLLLLGAWLIGGGMNAIMTWWSVSLALVGHNLGNEVLSREQLLHIVPVFVAVLVWLARMLIISSFVMTAERALARAKPLSASRPAVVSRRLPPQPLTAAAARGSNSARERPPQAQRQPANRKANGNGGRRPPMPRAPRGGRSSITGVQTRRPASGNRSRSA